MDFRDLTNALLCVIFAIIGGVFFVFPIVRSLLSESTGRRGKEDRADADQELCAKCQYDVRGLLRCPECGVETLAGKRERFANLREHWPTEHITLRVPAADERAEIILTTDDRWAVRLLCQHLEARGIPAQAVKSKNQLGTVYARGTSSYRLTVWAEDVERAKAIVEHLWPEELRG